MENSEKTPLWSVVIPIYNGGNYIERLAQSLEKQQKGQFEAILVDDGSTDQTYELCRKLSEKYEWIRLIHTENHGVSHARNTGLECARGKWIHFIDVDDEIHPELFTRFSEAAASDGAEMVICGCMRENLSTGERAYCGPEQSQFIDQASYAQFFRKMKMDKRYWTLDYIWNKWYRNDVIRKYQISFSEELSLGEDFVFNTKYFQKISSLVLIAEPLYYYQINAGGLASRFQPEPWKGRTFIYESHVQLCRELGIWESEQPEIQYQAGRIAFGDIRMINSLNCKLRFREKKRFIRKMLESSQFPLILYYLKQNPSMRFAVYEKVFRLKSPNVILWLISLEKYIWKVLKRN